LPIIFGDARCLNGWVGGVPFNGPHNPEADWAKVSGKVAEPAVLDLKCIDGPHRYARPGERAMR